VSYAPLWAMLALRALPGDVRPNFRDVIPWASIVLGALTAGSVWSGIALVRDTERAGNGGEPHHDVVESSRGVRSEHHAADLYGVASSDS
jgi:hypothetical protein